MNLEYNYFIMTFDEIRQTLETRFSPAVLRLVDQSHHHVGHPENMQGREMLLDLVLVSAAFEGKTLLEKHAAIYSALQIGKNPSIHGITIRAYSAAEWAKVSS